MFDICGVGHITLDKVVTPQSVKYMPGGTSYYFSNAIRQMDLNYLLVTALGANEMHTITELRSLGLQVIAYQTLHSVYFENIYSDLDARTQRVLRKADPFSIQQLKEVDAKLFHLGPLLADDMPADFIRDLASRGRISLDVQGLLRTVKNKNVVLTDWPEKNEVLQYVDILKANDQEMEVLTGFADPKDGAVLLHSWGVKEVVITLGHRGSLIYTGGRFYDIPAFIPNIELDTTGCGDTYMAGYLAQRVSGKSPRESGEFGAAMAALKIQSYGPFTGKPAEVSAFMKQQQKSHIPMGDSNFLK